MENCTKSDEMFVVPTEMLNQKLFWLVQKVGFVPARTKAFQYDTETLQNLLHYRFINPNNIVFL